MHLACDLAQGDAMMQLFPEEASLAKPGEEGWIFRTALKVLQDIDDAKLFDAHGSVQMMTWYQSPYGNETSEQLERYYNLYRDLYISGDVTIEEEMAVWVKAGMNEKLVERVNETAYRLKEAPRDMERVGQLFALSLKNYFSKTKGS